MPSRPAPPGPDTANQLLQLEALFHQALELPPAQRAAWVDEQLADDSEQAHLLKSMLEHAEAEETGVSRAIGEFARESAAPRDRSGEKIDRYRLIARIRYGGMAEVYRAARDDGQFDQEVALKVVRSDRVRPQLNELFAAERTLMARLKHPHIIQIFDGGTTAQGEAYFVMELLDGLPLLSAIARHNVDSLAVLGHLSDLCAAVNHLHGQLIVHRDIKPENVLLCRTPQGLTVKLIDFGIAARLNAGIDPEDAATPSPSGEGWHSPGYAAPEARDGQPSGAAADIYSLGKLLLDCVALVQPRFREELRAIGNKASQEDSDQRYSGAASVAEDLERMLRREPISLFRHHRLHVLHRAMDRHRWAVAAALVVVLAGSAWLWRESNLRVEAEQATVRAEAERDRAEAMRDFLLGAFDSSNPSLNRGDEPRVSDLIVDQLDLLHDANDLDPDAHYELLSSFGDLLLSLDRRDMAERAFTQATGLMESQGRQDGLQWIRMMTQRGQLASRDARYDDAADFFQQAGAALERLPTSIDSARAASMLYSSWGASEHRRGQPDEAERLIRIGLEAKPILQAANDPAGDDAAMQVTLGAIQSARDNLHGALQTFQTAYEDHQAAGRSDTFEHLALLGWLGITLDRLNRSAASEPYLVEAVALAEKLFPQPNSRLSGSYANLGRMYLNQGRLAEAAPLLHKSLEVSLAAGDADTPNHASRLYSLGLLAFEAERNDDAINLLEQALALWQSTLGASHRRILETRLNLAFARVEAGTDTLLFEVETLLADIEQAPFRIEALLLTARLAAETGERHRAEAALTEARELMAAADSSSPVTPNRLWLEGRARLALAQREEARSAFLAAAIGYQESGREHHPGRGRASLQAALLYPAGSTERQEIGQQARAILSSQLPHTARSLILLESL